MSTLDSLLNTPQRPRAESISDLRKRFVQNSTKMRDVTERYFHRCRGYDQDIVPDPGDPIRIPFPNQHSLLERIKNAPNDTPVIASVVKESIDDFLARNARLQGTVRFDLKPVVEHGFGLLGVVMDEKIREAFGLLAAKYVELCAEVPVNPAAVRQIMSCLANWVSDHVKDLELESLSLVDMVNKEFNLTIFFDNCAMLRDAILEMNEPVAKANLQRALGISERLEKLREFVGEIPKHLERTVFVPIDVDTDLVERILSFYKPVQRELIKPWILSDVKARSGRLAIARSQAMEKARKDWEAHARQSQGLHFRELAFLIDEYVSTATGFDEPFAVHLGFIFTVLDMCGKMLECRLPSVEVFAERMGIGAIESEKPIKLAVHSAAALLEKYEAMAKMYADRVVEDWTDTPVSKKILNAMVSIAMFYRNEADDSFYQDILRMSFSLNVGDVFRAIQCFNAEQLFDTYFQLKEYLLFIATRVHDEETEGLCAKLRMTLTGVIERGTRQYHDIDTLWHAVEDADVYLENFGEVRQLTSLLFALNILCKAAGKSDYAQRTRCLCVRETLISINAKLTHMSKPPAAGVQHVQFFSDANTDITALWDVFKVFVEYFNPLHAEDIYGIPPDPSEAYMIGLCQCELNSLKAMFIEDGFHQIQFQPLPRGAFNIKNGKIMNTVGDLQRFQKDLEAVLRARPNDELPNIAKECETLRQKLDEIIPGPVFEELSELRRVYGQTRVTWKRVRQEHVKMLRVATDATTERKWNERASLDQKRGIEYDVAHRQQAIQRAREDTVRINNSKACVVTDPENPDDIQRAERLLEIRKMNCLASVIPPHEEAKGHLEDIRCNAGSVIETIHQDWSKIRRRDRSLFEEALRLVQAVSSDNGGTANEDEAISMMMADTKKQVDSLTQRISYEKGESQRREEVLQFISVPRPRTSCNRARLEETLQMSHDVLDQLLDRRKKLIERERVLREELKHQQPT